MTCMTCITGLLTAALCSPILVNAQSDWLYCSLNEEFLATDYADLADFNPFNPRNPWLKIHEWIDLCVKLLSTMIRSARSLANATHLCQWAQLRDAWSSFRATPRQRACGKTY